MMMKSPLASLDRMLPRTTALKDWRVGSQNEVNFKDSKVHHIFFLRKGFMYLTG